MHFVILGQHGPEVCPTANATTRALLVEIAPHMQEIAEKNHVRMVSGPWVNREHLTVAVAEADRAEDLDRFVVESRLAQWNTVRIIPSMQMQDGLAEMPQMPTLF